MQNNFLKLFERKDKEANMIPMKAGAETLVTPTSGVMPPAAIKSIDNWRAFIHQAVPVIVVALVAINIVKNDQATQWIPFVFAIVDNLLSVGNAADRVRRAVYAAVGVLQTGGLVTTLVTSYAPEYVPVAGAVLTLITAFMARFYNPTTTLVPSMRTGPDIKDVT